MKIERNQWESEFFGREIGSLIFELEDHILPPLAGEVPCEAGSRGEQAVSFCQNFTNFPPSVSLCSTTSPASGGRIEGISLLQAKTPTTDLNTIHWLQQHGFQLVETEITFVLEFAKFPEKLTACECRIAEKTDVAALKKLVGSAFPHTRFRPPYFSQAENQRFYAKWIENAVKGEFDDLCLIAEQDGKLQGTISLRFNGKTAKIGLLAVASEFQRQGIAKRLLSAAISHAKHHNAENLHITTQLSNIAAISLYQSIGATISETNYWFYQFFCKYL
ncbi:dTDP-4-amino-4,6-dideoxy-D-galactose acyltransferase [Frederiksenia canicola]|uniref:TDP-D-fucosamine acetyltransferase n=1 Tax=Frederiksenia canicola TaxID=123824 RepID=A0ABX9XNS0_9PAST|nr:dTDP-4-amino-4,6-dideoxy-D-galactose acyltransferase [Frederiksenia canicola]RPE90999.1 TDP-D-fucosamine acetyltransferase [Frederiksenia canicola]